MNDKKVFLIIFAVSAAFCLFFGSVSLYSKVFVERKVNILVSEIEKEVAAVNASSAAEQDEQKLEEINKKYKQAYLLVRKPQMFAGYKNFDGKSFAIKNVIQQFDQIVFTKIEFPLNSYHYINYLLQRRVQGSGLGIYTALVLLMITLGSGFFYIKERKN